jgi:hypothetical protein
MATKPIQKITFISSDLEIWKWENLQLNDDGEILQFPKLADKTIQVYGTFGASGHLFMEGTNEIDTPTWNPVNDPQGEILDFDTPKIKQVLENPLAIRPHVTNGDGTTSLTVVIICRG